MTDRMEASEIIIEKILHSGSLWWIPGLNSELDPFACPVHPTNSQSIM